MERSIDFAANSNGSNDDESSQQAGKNGNESNAIDDPQQTNGNQSHSDISASQNNDNQSKHAGNEDTLGSQHEIESQGRNKDGKIDDENMMDVVERNMQSNEQSQDIFKQGQGSHDNDASSHSSNDQSSLSSQRNQNYLNNSENR